jgi:hypothetical protein
MPSEGQERVITMIVDLLTEIRDRLPAPVPAAPAQGKPVATYIEPAVGAVLIDNDGDTWTRRPDGWRHESTPGVYPWASVVRYAPLTQIRSAQAPVTVDSVMTDAMRLEKIRELAEAWAQFDRVTTQDCGNILLTILNGE